MSGLKKKKPFGIHFPLAHDLEAFLVFSQNPPRIYFTAQPIENLVYCFYKTKPVASIFYEFTGTINHRFLTSQNA